MAKLKIILGDLYHINQFQTIYTPINIGYMASYATKLFGKDIECHLFRDANKLIKAADEIKPDLVGLSLYHWATAVDAEVIKNLIGRLKKRPFFVLGGPSIDTIPREQKKLTDKMPGLDAIIVNEGEVAFSNLVGAMLSDPINFNKNPIDGVIKIDKEGKLIKSKPVPLLDLNELPSPYLGGFLEEFTQSPYKPQLQTLRGCPYACKFCVSGRDTIKIRKFPMEQIKEEILYIAERYKNHNHIELQIVDDNFGLYPRDVEIAKFISDTSEKVGHPKGIKFFNNKQLNKISYEVLDAVGKINKIGLNISLQTDTPETLAAMGRKNITEEKIKEANDWAAARKIDTTTELIFGLPGESKKTFLSLLDRSVKRGFDNILSHNLILLDGSELNREEERTKHNFKTKWRLPGPNYSDIDGKFVTEAEQVVVGTNTFDYDDYLHIRTHNFFYYAVYSLRFFRWFFKSLQSVDIAQADFFDAFLFPDKNKTWPIGYLNYLKDLKNAFEGELYDTEEELIKDMEAKFRANNNEVLAPTRLNSLYAARLIYMERSWIKEVLEKHLNNFGFKSDNPKWKTIQEVINICLKERIDLRNTKDSSEPIVTMYDYVAWKETKFRLPLEHFKLEKPAKLNFAIDDVQKERIISFHKEQGKMKDWGFFYKAQDAIVPRSQLLFKLEIVS